jgi:DNA-binding transcriptional LysR family regulator
MMTIDFNALAVVVRVVRAGSFTAAARELETTKQWVSRRVADAERTLGVPLLERTTRSLKPTRAGARIIERAGPALSSIAEALTEAETAQTEAVGSLRVTAPLLFGRRFLVPIVAAYREANPRVLVELQLSDRQANLVDEEIDVAIRVGRSPDSNLLSRRLGVAPVQLFASPEVVTRHGLTRKGASLEGVPAVVSRARERWRLEEGVVQPTAVLVVTHLETQLEAALAGLGVAALPAFLARPFVASGKLVALLQGRPVRAGVIQVLSPHRKAMPLRVRRFIDVVVAQAPDLS